MKRFKFLSHTADVKFQAFGKSLDKVFENSSLALKEIILKDKIKIHEKEKKKIKVKGKDLESLLYNFLEEFLFLLDSKGFILSKVKKLEINMEKDKSYELEAEVSGDKAKRYKFNNDVKAVTYNQMFVKQEKGKWISQVVLDV